MTKPRHQPHRFRQPSARRPVSRFDFIEGVARLAASGAVEITDLVEGIHREIVVKPFERVIPGWSSYWDRSISSKVYCVVRKAMSFSGEATATTLRALNSKLERYEQNADLPKTLKLLNNVINGVMGDHLVTLHSPLAAPMLVYDRYGDLHCETQLSGRVLLMVHGLCMSYLSWDPGQASGMGEHIVYAEPDVTLLMLDYNTGRRISLNGRDLSDLLEELVLKNPQITQLDFVGHSMGGLIVRSAMFCAKQEGRSWLPLAKNLICLAAPHHGAVLERIGFYLQQTISKIPIAGNLAHLLDLRSAGIIDLRHGSVRDDDWEFLTEGRMGRGSDFRRPAPLPANVNCFLVAVTIDKSPQTAGRDILGDGLVNISSALGEHPGDHDLNVPENHKAVFYDVNHMEAQFHERVREQVIRWLGMSQRQIDMRGERIISVPDVRVEAA